MDGAGSSASLWLLSLRTHLETLLFAQKAADIFELFPRILIVFILLTHQKNWRGCEAAKSFEKIGTCELYLKRLRRRWEVYPKASAIILLSQVFLVVRMQWRTSRGLPLQTGWDFLERLRDRS